MVSATGKHASKPPQELFLALIYLQPVTASIFNRIQALQLHAYSGDQGTVTYKEQGTWTWFEIVVLENEKSNVPMIKNKIEHAWKSHLNPMETEGLKWVRTVICSDCPGVQC